MVCFPFLDFEGKSVVVDISLPIEEGGGESEGEATNVSCAVTAFELSTLTRLEDELLPEVDDLLTFGILCGLE